MSEGFNYQIIVEGINQAVDQLAKLNKALSGTEKSAQLQNQRFEILSNRISDLTSKYGESGSQLRNYLSTLVDVNKSTRENDLRIQETIETYQRSLAKTKDHNKALATASKSYDDITERVRRKLKEERKATKTTEGMTKAAETLATTQKAIASANEEALSPDAANARAAELKQIKENQKAAEQLAKQEKDSREVKSAAMQASINDQKKLDNELIRSDEELNSKRVQDAIDIEQKFRDLTRNETEKRLKDKQKADKESLDSDRDIHEALIANNIEAEKKREREREKARQKAKKEALKTVQDRKKQAEETRRQYEKNLKDLEAYLTREFNLRNSKAVNVGQTQAADRGAALKSNIDKDPELKRVYGDHIDKVNKALVRNASLQTIATEKVKEFTLSWQTMGRIAAAQAFNQVFFGIQASIRQAVSEAAELLISIAEVQTITDRSAASLEDYYANLSLILSSSDKLNFSAIDVANAYYETLSNQIGGTASQIQNFITISAQLGKTTRTTLGESADALASIINSYSLSVEDATKVSASLFALVDQGRLKLEQVADRIGSVSVPASQLGASFDEVFAGIAVLSRAGVPITESMTLLRNLLFKMIDPTKAMTELIQSWGSASAQAAIETFGFTGVIEKLSEAAREGDEAVAEFSGTIRATRAVLGLTGKNLEVYKKALDEIENAHKNYAKIVEDFAANPGEQFNKMLNEIHNTFLRVGITIVEITVKLDHFIQKLGGINAGIPEVVSALGTLGIALFTGGAAFAITTTSVGFFIGSLEALGLTVSVALGPIGLIVAAVAAIGTVALISSSSFSKSFGDIKAAAIEANKEVSKIFSDEQNKQITKQAYIIDKQYQEALKRLASQTKRLREEIRQIGAEDTLENLTSSYDRLIKALSGGEAEQRIAGIFDPEAVDFGLFQDGIYETTDALKGMTTQYDSQISKLQQQRDELEKIKGTIRDTAADNAINLAVDQTNRRISTIYDPTQKAQAQLKAAQDAARQAAQAQDPEESKKLFDIARRFLADSEATAGQGTGFFSELDKANYYAKQAADLNAYQEQRLQYDYNIADEQQKQVDQKGQQLTKEQEIINYELERRDALQQNYEFMKAYVDEYDRLLTMIRENADLTPEEKLAQTAQLATQFSQGAQQLGFDSNSQAAIDRSVLDAQKQTELSILEQQQKDIVLKKEQEAQAEAAAREASQKVATSVTDIAANFETAANSSKDAIKPGVIQDILIGFLTSALPGAGVILGEKRVKDQLSYVDRATEIQGLQERANQAEVAFQADVNNPQAAQNFADTMAALTVQLQQYNLENDPNLKANIAAQESVLANAEAMDVLILANNNLKEALDASAFKLTAALDANTLALYESGRIPAPGFAKGGPVGTDTIPAWLSPGEYVVNAAATRRNFNWLEAINYGGARRYATGGYVNSNQSFTNNFNITSSNPNMQTGSIVNAIRRQIAQGKATLSKRRPY